MPAKKPTKNEAEIAKLLAEADNAKAEARYNQLLVEKLEHEKSLRDAAEYTHRIYTFDAEVTGRSVQDCMSTLGLWRRQDPSRPIKVIFNSPGGSVFDGLALYDYIVGMRQDGTRVDTEGIGMVASMGGILLQAGEKRTLSPSAWFMIHEVSSFKFGSEKISQEEEQLKFKKRLQARCLDILASRSEFTSDEIKQKAHKTDWWMDSEEARKAGFCDEVK
jgi:ATP-dependent Clp protease protease subunit